ncbi:MAG: hypothetical protein R3D52_14125 [Xanthobacteraceae bacterium]
MNERGATILGARTFETQLDDGRWLQISERRTRMAATSRSAPTSPRSSRHEAQLVQGERRLMATIADLHAPPSRRCRRRRASLPNSRRNTPRKRPEAEEANQAKSEIPRQYLEPRAARPLNAIIGFFEIMEARLFGPLGVDRYDEYCRDIRESVGTSWK